MPASSSSMSAKGGARLDGETASEMDHDMERGPRRCCTSRGVPHDVRTLVRGQEPASDVVSIADEEGADLIVIGLRRRSPVGKLILGSNAQQVLLDAHCPVLAVKATSDDGD